MKKFSIILTSINTSQEIDSEKFGIYAFNTAEILVTKYNWWPMSPTVHKILVHGEDIINFAVLPVGMFA